MKWSFKIIATRLTMTYCLNLGVNLIVWVVILTIKGTSRKVIQRIYIICVLPTVMIRAIFLSFFFMSYAFAQQKVDFRVADEQHNMTQLIHFQSNISVGKVLLMPAHTSNLVQVSGNYFSVNLKPILLERTRCYFADGTPIESEKANQILLKKRTLNPELLDPTEAPGITMIKYIELTAGTKKSFTKKGGNSKETYSYSVMEINALNEDLKDEWNLVFQKGKHYLIDMEFGLGKGKLILSDIGVKKLKVHTASSDVDIIYVDKPNLIVMDTMEISVGLANLNINNVELARAKNIFVNAGFGSVVMNFKNQICSKCKVEAVLGAGTMKVNLPAAPTAVIIRLKGTFFSSYKIPANFVQAKPGIFINETYRPNAQEILLFDVDISMGSIVFANH